MAKIDPVCLEHMDVQERLSIMTRYIIIIIFMSQQ